ISKIEYRPGHFHVAMRSRASRENEQNVVHLSTAHGEILFRQIAGWIARRVLFWKSEGDPVALGERVGMIRFGSRVDVWLPAGAEVLVRPGQHVAGGRSVLARWSWTGSSQTRTGAPPGWSPRAAGGAGGCTSCPGSSLWPTCCVDSTRCSPRLRVVTVISIRRPRRSDSLFCSTRSTGLWPGPRGPA